MKLFCLIFFSCCFGNGFSYPPANQNDPLSDWTLLFDYRVEYAYTTPSVPYGNIIAYYNSQDKYVLYNTVSPFMDEGTQLLVFFDGSSVLFSQSDGSPKALIYNATLPERKKTTTLESRHTFWNSILPSGRKADIAGYEAVEYKGELPDNSKRTVWISEESFDARALHAPLPPSINFLPLQLTESVFLNDHQFLLSSEIALTNGQKYFLTVTYLEYELKKIDFKEFENQIIKVENSLAQTYHHTKCILWQEKYESWLKYDRFNGLEYEPRKYDFDVHAIYDVKNETFQGQIDVFFNTTYEFCLIQSELFSNGLNAVLGFKDGTVIAYFAEKMSAYPPGEAIFFDPGGDHMHLDQPALIYANQQKFDDLWQMIQSNSSRIGGLDGQEYQSASKSNKGEQLGIARIPFDPRTLYLDYHSLLDGFPNLFSHLSITPRNHLVTNYATPKMGLVSNTLKLRSYEVLRQPHIFSDEPVPLFYRMVVR